jgi:cytochrome c553
LLSILLMLFLPAGASAQIAEASTAVDVELGRRIYTEGITSSGAELSGERSGNGPVNGPAAACVNCHRPSGMGQVEADILVPPITGNFLFATRSDKRIVTMDPRVSKLFNQAHDPYTEASLAAAIRNGVNNRGQVMSVAMPRYRLSDGELKALTSYLTQLSAQWSPGVTSDTIRFATVITPDVDPLRRKVFIDMMRAIFRQKNGSTVTAKQSRTRHHMISAAELILGTERNWELDIWELQGPAETWGEQLATRYRAQPVFALVSGLSSTTWQPVHDFCGAHQVPCWFPSVDVAAKNKSSYALYFSAGVNLEAAVLARHLRQMKDAPIHLMQIYRDDAPGRAGAKALTQALEGSKISVTDRALRPELAPVEALTQALGTTGRGDAVMFWLRADDVQALKSVKPVARMNYFSGRMAMGEHAPVPTGWRPRSYLVYPYELPSKRAKNLDYFYAWLSIAKIALVDEAMQSEVFFSLNFMTDTLSEMLDNPYRDYLVERAETMLSIREGVKSEQETRDRLALGREGDLLKKHGVLTIVDSARIPITNQQGDSGKSHGTTLYPHLSLGPDQRFASKSAYIVRFAHESGEELTSDSELIVP